MKKWFIITLGMVVISVWLLPGTVRAHGEPVISVNPLSVPAGSEVLVTGTEMEEGEVFSITLEGLTMSITLGEATVTGEGFEIMLTIPADVPPSSYRVQAATEEGETAVADLTITPPINGVDGDKLAEGQPEPSAEPMALDRPGSAARTTGIIVVALLSLGVGFWLIRP
mgnify:CR=1 FL=1